MDMTDMTRAAVSRRHFLQLAGAGMLALTGTALTGCGNSTSGEGSDKGSKLAAIKSRGHLNAGVKKDVPGYGYYDTAKGRFEGMEVDLCYQIAAAVFGVSYKEARAQELVEFTDVTPKTRGPLIDNGQLDVVAATYTITDERKKSWDFSTPYRTDYVGLMVKKRSGFTSIEDLDGKVIGVAPVGCSVFAYDYFNCDMYEAAHGRAPAVATGAKRVVGKDTLVFTYQGDGDLSAIGTAESIHAAARGENVVAIYINNAIYGMTGGQMAPTTLLGMKTATTPYGRDPRLNGYPYKIAEMMAHLDGATFITRQSVHTPANVRKCKRAIRKAFENSMAGKGFSLVEVVSTCNSGWKLSPVASNEWLEQNMLPYYPLGDIKDVK